MQFLNNYVLINYIKSKESGSIALVLIIIIFVIGIGTTIYLSNRLLRLSCDSSMCVEVKAKQYVGTMIRIQYAYYYDHNTFVTNPKEIRVSLGKEAKYYDSSKKHYDYSNEVTANAVYYFAIPKNPQIGDKRSYSSALFIIANKGEYLQAICESNKIGVIPSKPILKNGEVICPKNMTVVK